MWLLYLCAPFSFLSARGDLLVEHIKTTRSFKAAPKSWHNIIKKFFTLNLKEMPVNDSLITYVYTSFSQRSKCVARNKNRVIETPSKAGLVYSSRERMFFGFETVEAPSGQILDCFWCKKSQDATFLELRWGFFLDQKLSLNTTFLRIFIPVGSPGQCLRVGLLVTHKPKRHYRDFNIQHDPHQMLYCGEHSQFPLHYSGHTVYYALGMYLNLYHEIHFVFEVMDSDVVRSFNTRRFSHKFRYLRHIPGFSPLFANLKIKDTVIHAFWFQTEFTNYIILTQICKEIQLKVCDGPSLASKNIEANNFKFKTTTFQATVLLSAKSRILRQYQKILEYRRRRQKVGFQYKLKNHTGMNLVFSGRTCHGIPCVLRVESDQQFLNVTVTRLTYKGPRSFHFCKFGGVALTPKERTRIGDSNFQALCETKRSRSLYSQSSTLSIVVYCFVQCESFTTSLKIQSTNCFPVHLDPCSYFFVVERRFLSFMTKRKRIEKFSDSSHVSFFNEETLSPLTSARDLLPISYQIADETCAVLTISRRIGPEERCSFKLLSTKIEESFCHISHIFQAFIVPETLIKTKMTKFKLQTFPDQMTYFSNTHLGKRYGGRKAVQLTFQPQTTDTFVFVAMNATTPCFLGETLFEFTFAGWSRSWAEIQVWKTAAPKVRRARPRVPSHTFISEKAMTATNPNFESGVDFLLSGSHPDPNFGHLSVEITSYTGFDTGEHFRGRLFCKPDHRKSTWSSLDEIHFQKVTTLFFTHPEIHTGEKISVGGIINFLKLKLTNETLPNQRVIFEWINPRVPKLTSSRCKTMEKIAKSHLSFCLNFSVLSSTLSSHTIIYRSLGLTRDENSNNTNQIVSTDSRHEELFSWSAADKLCSDIEGFLPAFFSKDKLDTFLRLYKTSPHLPPLSAIYIGLLNQTRKVDVLFLRNHFVEQCAFIETKITLIFCR